MSFTIDFVIHVIKNILGGEESIVVKSVGACLNQEEKRVLFGREIA